MEPARVRSLRRDDAAGLIALARDLAVALADPPPVLTPALLEETALGADPWCRVLVAERAGRLVGYAATCRRFEPHIGKKSLWLADLHVDAGERRHGTGRRLMAAVAGEAVAEGCDLLLWDLWTRNESARAFYAALGAERDAELEVWRIDPCRLCDGADPL